MLSASEIRRIMEDLEDARSEKDQLMQKCHDLEMQVNLLRDEKNNLNSEYELLQKEVRATVLIQAIKQQLFLPFLSLIFPQKTGTFTTLIHV